MATSTHDSGITRSHNLQLLDEEESADEDFWKQDFFAEEDKDSEFEASESEQEDIPDADFSESVRCLESCKQMN